MTDWCRGVNGPQRSLVPTKFVRLTRAELLTSTKRAHDVPGDRHPSRHRLTESHADLIRRRAALGERGTTRAESFCAVPIRILLEGEGHSGFPK